MEEQLQNQGMKNNVDIWWLHDIHILILADKGFKRTTIMWSQICIKVKLSKRMRNNMRQKKSKMKKNQICLRMCLNCRLLAYVGFHPKNCKNMQRMLENLRKKKHLKMDPLISYSCKIFLNALMPKRIISL